MSYNKLKALVANVEAIETAMQIHVQGRQATPKEKEILSLYSGFGGYQRGIEYRDGQTHRRRHDRTDTKVAGAYRHLPTFHRTHASQRHGSRKSLRTDSVLHPEIPC